MAGVLGGLGDGDDTGPEDPAASSAAVTDPSGPAPAASPDSVGRVIRLWVPAYDGAVVTTRALVVSGTVSAGTGPVRIGLGSGSGKALAFETIEPPAERGDRPHAFAVELPAGGPRPGGTMTVQVIAYDDSGIPIDVVRRQVVLGPIERTVGGEDGVMGALTQ